MQLPSLKQVVGAIRSAASELRAGVAGAHVGDSVVPPAPPPAPAVPREYDPAEGPISQKAFDQISNWMTGQGQVGDPALAARYLLSATIDWQTLSNVCRASWLARKIVWKKPTDMLRAGYNLIWEGCGDKKKGEKSTQADLVRYAIQQKWDADRKIIQAMAWARQFGGSVIVIGIKGQLLDQPLPVKDGKVDYSGIKKGMLQSLQVWDRWRANHDGQIDDDPNSPNRGKPLFHVLSSDGGLTGQKVHWTRVLRFDGDIVDWWTWRANACWHDSVLQVLLETLKQYDMTVGAISALIPKALRDVIYAKDAAKHAATDAGFAAMSARYGATARLASLWNVSVYDMEKEKHEQQTFQFANLDKIWEKSMREVGGGAGYPVSVLFDEQPEGLNANGGASQSNYYNDVVNERKLTMEPNHLALLEVITRNELGDLPAGFAVEYNPMTQPTPAEQATINKTNAEADHIRLEDGVVLEGMIARELKERSVYRTMTQEDVNLVDMKVPMNENGEVGEEIEGRAGGVTGSAIALTPTMQGAIITVNQALAQLGLPSWPDADGNLTIAEFQAKHSGVIAAAVNAEAGMSEEDKAKEAEQAAANAKAAQAAFAAKGKQPDGKEGEPDPNDQKKSAEKAKAQDSDLDRFLWSESDVEIEEPKE